MMILKQTFFYRIDLQFMTSTFVNDRRIVIDSDRHAERQEGRESQKS